MGTRQALSRALQSLVRRPHFVPLEMDLGSRRWDDRLASAVQHAEKLARPLAGGAPRPATGRARSGVACSHRRCPAGPCSHGITLIVQHR
jgi:hypothetical protein